MLQWWQHPLWHFLICSLNGKLVLFVAGYDGVVFTYDVNTNEGGECKQLNRHALIDVTMNSKSMQLSSNDLELSKVGKSVQNNENMWFIYFCND